MIVRLSGDECVVVAREGEGFLIDTGEVFAWSDMLCARMVTGLAPRIALDTAHVPSYRDAPLAHRWRIGSYIGTPLFTSSGALFGSLCVLDSSPRGEAPAALALVDIMGQFLSGFLALEARAAEAERLAQRAQQELLTDELTGLLNRRGWEALIAAEEDRCQRHGHSAAILAVDLDGLKLVNDSAGHTAGDDLLRRFAAVMKRGVRAHDAVARLGGDEFAVLVVESDERSGYQLAERIALMLEEAGIGASIGFAARTPGAGLRGAIIEADAQMYEAKRLRHGVALHAPG